MYSLTINFGPTGTAWAFLFKDKENAEVCRARSHEYIAEGRGLEIIDDFGQHASFLPNSINGIVFEDLEQVEAARIYRSLAEERIKVKLMAAAKSDPLIAEAMRRAQGAPVLTPMGGFRG